MHKNRGKKHVKVEAKSGRGKHLLDGRSGSVFRVVSPKTNRKFGLIRRTAHHSTTRNGITGS